MRVTASTAGSAALTVTHCRASRQPYQVNLGTGDSDAFGYDANTARMNQYQFNVNSQSVKGRK